MLKKILLLMLGMFVVFHLLSALFTSWYTLGESEQAVVEFRGKPIETVKEPGFKFKLPYPYSKVHIVPLETFSMPFGYAEEDGKVVENVADAKMITGDENIVLADLVVQWRITDPQKYLYNNEDPEATLHNATSSSLRSVIGSSKIDDALTSGKAEIEAKVWEKLTEQMAMFDIGISISAVKLQDVDLPNKEVRKAFTDVTDARETMNTKINEADKYRNQRINEAQGEKDALISKAEGEKASRIQEATGDVAVFNSLYREYKVSKSITRDRLVLETLDEVLKDAQIYVMSNDGSTMKYLPIQAMKSTDEGKR